MSRQASVFEEVSSLTELSEGAVSHARVGAARADVLGWGCPRVSCAGAGRQWVRLGGARLWGEGQEERSWMGKT